MLLKYVKLSADGKGRRDQPLCARGDGDRGEVGVKVSNYKREEGAGGHPATDIILGWEGWECVRPVAMAMPLHGRA